MKHNLRRGVVGLLGSVSLAVLGSPAFSADVTQDRLLNPDKEPQNWLTNHHDFSATRYSTLNQINRGTVGNLKLVIHTTLGSVSPGGRYAFGTNEATPLVDDGFMYVPDPWGVVAKIDVRDGKQGKIVWRMDPQVDRAYASDAACCGAENRGVALWGNQVLTTTMDGRLMALNRDSGEVTWTNQIASLERIEVLTTAPLAVKGMAVLGPAGGEYGIRGWVAAINVADGKQVWKTYTIPGPGEPGHETWSGRDWETGGASIWETGSFDPASNTTYWGTGNPAPQWDAEYRPGDNLYSDSLLALDADSGKMKWYFQYTPNDPYDYDEIGETQLIDVTVGGQPRKIAMHAGRNGFVYGFDRGNGQFLYAKQYVDTLTWTKGIDPKTGKPIDYDPTKQLQDYVPGTNGRRDHPLGVYCPTLGGGKNWQPAAYNPVKQTLYVPSNEGCSAYLTVAAPVPTVTGGTWNLRNPKNWDGRGAAPTDTPKPNMTGQSSVSAIDPITGEKKAKILTDFRYHGMLATAGGLVFAGDRGGNIVAWNDDNLAQAWSFNVGASLKAPPMTYSVNGKQYIAIIAGSAPSAFEKTLDPSLQFFTPANDLFVFGL